MLAKTIAVLIGLFAIAAARSTGCRCSDVSMCDPIRSNRSGLEFVAFSTTQDPNIYKLYDWSKLTTVVITGLNKLTEDMVCYAHSKGVKVTLLVAAPIASLDNATLRMEFVLDVVKKVSANGLDGVNMDFEGNIRVNSSEYNGLTALMKQMRKSLLTTNPHYTLSMDYVNCPDCIGGRTYDYKTIQNYIDYFILMDYDMQGSQVQKGQWCTLLVNSPYWAVYERTKEFLEKGVSPKKLVMAFPWYGYQDPCGKFDDSSQTCYTDCSHSDSGSLQVCFSQAMGLLRTYSMEGRQWNTKTLTPSLSYTRNGQKFQVNYDDAWSLQYKYQLALYFGVRGVGTWTVNCLDFSNTPHAIADRNLMWSVIPTGK